MAERKILTDLLVDGKVTINDLGTLAGNFIVHSGGILQERTTDEVISDLNIASLIDIDSENISNVVFLLSNGDTIVKSFDHVHTNYALKNWVEDNYLLIEDAYGHPTYNGDDITIESSPLTGAFVISDVVINLTTDTLGHVSVANASFATRELTLGDLGYSDYELEVATATTLGGIMIGYTATGANLPVELLNSQAFVGLTKSAIEEVLTGEIDTHTHAQVADEYVDSVGFDTATGILTLGRAVGDDLTKNLDGRYLLITNPPDVGTLKTDITTTLATSASESFEGAISLHKVSKTGTYSDLIGKPDLVSLTNLGRYGLATLTSGVLNIPLYLDYQSNTDIDTGTETVATIPFGDYTGFFFDYVISNGTNSRVGTVMVVKNGSTLNPTETSTTDIGNTEAVSLSVIISGTNILLQATATSDNWSVKTLIRTL